MSPRLLFATLTVALAFAMATPAAKAATLIHTNDILGEVEPCGCRNNPQGGMARKSNMLKKLKDQEQIQVDAGDLLFPSTTIAPLLTEQSEVQAGYLLKAMKLAGHDVVVPGEKDFALGFKTLEKLVKSSGVKFIAANLRKKNGTGVFPSNVILQKKGENGKPLRIAIFGIVGNELTWPAELKVLNPVAEAKKQIQELRKKADLVIALTHQGYDKDMELAKAVPGIDVIVGGHSQSFLQNPIKVGTALILQSSFRNQYVGVLPLKSPISAEGYELVGLDAGYDSAAGAPSPMDQLVLDFKKAIADVNTKKDAMLLASATETLGGSKTKFQTFPKCAECHLKQFDFWRKTNHARAYHALVSKQQEKNKECLSCHTVGLGDAQGFNNVTQLATTSSGPVSNEEIESYLMAMHKADSLKSEVKLIAKGPAQPLRGSLNTLQQAWTPVQCENCHTPGGDHPFSSGYSKKVEKSACLKCHTSDQAPEWYQKNGSLDEKAFEAKRAMVTCPVGELSETD